LEFDEIILENVFARTLTNYSLLLPDEKLVSALDFVDKELPDDMITMAWRVKRFINSHGPSAPLAIGMMNTIIDMRKMGINDCKVYFALQERLDNCPDSLQEYIMIITDFEKELK